MATLVQSFVCFAYPDEDLTRSLLGDDPGSAGQQHKCLRFKEGKERVGLMYERYDPPFVLSYLVGSLGI